MERRDLFCGAVTMADVPVFTVEADLRQAAGETVSFIELRTNDHAAALSMSELEADVNRR